jgi:hypothetical protein
LNDIAAKAQGVAGLTAALDRLGLRFTTRQFAQAAEDVPLLLLESLSTAEVGQSLVFAQPGGARILTNVQAQRAPVDRRTAADAIGEYLRADRKRQRVGEAMASLRQNAALQYQGAFAKPQAAAAPSAGASAAERN